MKKTLDLGKDKIGKLLISFSIPCIISMLINSIYNIVDQIFIGQGVGYVGNAATNVIFPLVIICNAIAGLLGNGCSANLSLRLGEDKADEASKSVGSTIIFTILVSILFSVIAYLFLPTLVNWFGCTENVYPYAMAYGKIILIGAPFMIIYTALSSIIRADGSPRYSMIVLVIGAIINIVLDAIFILKFNMGVEGGALATVIGQVVSCIMALIYLRKFKSIHLNKEDYKIDSSILKVMGYGLSSFITQGTVLALFIFMNNIMTKYGVDTKFGSDIPLSVYGVISKLNNLYVSSVLGISIGAQPIIGFNYGAGNKKRVRETLNKVLVINFIIGICFNLAFLLFPKQLVSLFGSSDNRLYLEFAVDCCRIFLGLCCLNALEMTASIVIQSLGNIFKATIVSFIRQIILFIPLALILTHSIGLYGALYAGPLADLICFTIVIFIYGSEYRKISSKESGFSEEFIHDNEQRKNVRVTEYNNEDQIFIAESKVIKEVAKKGSCVIVGRCADYVLEDFPNVTRIFLYSSLENKIKRAVKYYHLDEKQAQKTIEKINKERAKHYKYYTNRNWQDFSHYDLVINVDTLGVEKTKEIIEGFVKNQK